MRTVTCLAAALALSVVACDDDQRETGTLTLNLVGQAPSGNVYRLRDAIITVQGPSSTTFWNTEDDPNRTSLSEDVVVGAYDAFLQEGWRLERLAADGTGTQVEAELLSANPIFFDVIDDQRTLVALRFRVGDDSVDLGQGYDIVIDVEEPGPAAGYCIVDEDCGTGETCCLAGFLGTCQALAEGEACPLPDLTISAEAAVESMFINYQSFPPTSCAVAEGCVAGIGTRRLLNFSTQTPNVGAADMIMGDPTDVPGFEFSACHGHYHFNGYARYELLDKTGAVAATGHKQAFCLLDLSPLPGTTTGPRYHCGFQGISAGWSDVYGAGLDCQWVDITDVAPGTYQLRITINGEQTLPEADYTNNTAIIPVVIPAGTPPTPGDPLAACGGPESGPGRDCGWQIAEGHQAVACTPGAPVVTGCGGSAGGVCTDDPVLRICDGDGACTAVEALVSVDDTADLCPEASFVCPPSGAYTVLTGAFAPGSPYTCEVAP